MKRSTVILVLLLSFLLSSCASQRQERLVQVSVVETDGVTAEENGIWIQSNKR